MAKNICDASLCRIVVDAGRVNLQHLAPEHLLRRPDVADAGQQFLEVIPAPGPLEPLVIQRKALDDVFPQPLRGPDAELRAAVRLHAVAHGDDDVEVVELGLVVFAIGGSCQVFLDD